MKKNNLGKLLGIALVVAIVATGVFYGLFVDKLSSSTGSNLKMVVAARPLKAGDVLQASDLKTIPWPLSALPKGTYGSTKDLVGNTVYDAIGVDEPVVTTRLTATQAATVAIPPGMRAVSIHVTDSSGVLELIRSGHKVDIQVVAARKAANGETEVRTALENLTVLAVNTKPEQSSQGTSNPVMTLVATPQEADVLAAADSTSRIRVLLRNPNDDAVANRPAITLENVIKDIHVHTASTLSPAQTQAVLQAVAPKPAPVPVPVAAAPAAPVNYQTLPLPTPESQQGGRIATKAGQPADRP